MATSNDPCSTFKKIEDLSRKLLAKGAAARFLDKGKDSQMVARLIDRLREALVCYQVCCCYPAASITANNEKRYRSSK